MKKTLLFSLISLLLFGSVKLTAGTYSGGDGTSGNPYQIATLNDLIELSNTSGDWNKHFIQTANIDAGSTSTLNGGAGFSPIGNNSTKFSGTYNGQEHTISYLYINRNAAYQGLFGYVDGSSASISNLGLVSVNITSSYSYVGGLVGLHLGGTISNCFVTGSVSGSSLVGGFVGQHSSGIISNCYVDVSVSGTDNVGGFVGYIPYLACTISNCYSLGGVSRTSGSNETFGGFCGQVLRATITNCYSRGSVNFGTNKGFIGLVVYSSTLTNNFFDSQTSGQTSGTGATAKITEEMKSQSTFTDWDFTTTWVMSSDIAFNGYPTLRWTDGYAVEPTGTPKEIASLPNLVWVAENSSRWADNYIQTANINMWTVPSWHYIQGWTPIGNATTKFTGYYNGQGHTIKKLYIKRYTDYQGLFGYVEGSSSSISNLGLVDVDITGYQNIGGLLGYNSNGIVSNCYITGSITGKRYVGGLLGYNSSGNVSYCYSTGKVQRIWSSDNELGGFCGFANGGTIQYCYSTGSINFGTDRGFVGGENSSPTFTNNFFDQTTSGQTSGTGATAKTTSQMKTQSTFTGWDFTTIWNIQSGSYSSYPYLRAITYDNPGETTLGNPIPGLTSCANPSSGGTIAAAQTICYNTAPNQLTNSALPTGHTGDLEYKWQSSTTSSSTGFSDISSSNSVTYQPGTLTQTTWYRRLARVDCMGDWTGAAVSNVIEITVRSQFTAGEIANTGETINYNTSPTQTIGSQTDASGGDGNFTYSWRSSADNFTNAISGATSATYLPAGPLTASRTYRRYAVDNTCNTTPAQSTGEWTVTVNPTPTVQASGITFSNVTRTSMTVKWTRGNGEGCVLLGRMKFSIPQTPLSDGTQYTGNANYSTANEVGGAKVLYVGSDANPSVNVTGLTLYQLVRYKVCEYNVPLNPKYLQTENSTNPRSRWTLRRDGLMEEDLSIDAEYAYPNPASNTITTVLDVFEAGNIIAKLYDMSGKNSIELYNQKHSFGTYELTFDISKVPLGLYQLVINNGNEAVVYPISIVR